MDNDNLIIKREDVYVGALVQAYKIRRCLKNDLYTKKGEYMVSCFHPYRAIIFNIENDKAFDLLYGDEYPILNVCDDINEKMVLVDKIVNLNIFLKKVGYNEFLSSADINNICNNILKSDVILENKDIVKGDSFYDYICSLNDKNILKILISKLVKIKELIDVYDYNRLLYVSNCDLVRSYEERGMEPFSLTKQENMIKSLKME